MKKHKIIITALMVLIVNYSPLLKAEMEEIPEIVAAPIILYDEANNLLPDGEYTIQVFLKDSSQNIIFEEEHRINVLSSVANIALGSGFAIGSNFRSASGGLNYEIFNQNSDITVEIQVEGQSQSQEIAVFASQPYSYISQHALTVANDSVTSNKISNGTIRSDDLDETFLSQILNSNITFDFDQNENESLTFDLDDIAVPSGIGLNNASGNNLEEILRSFDSSMDVLRNVTVNNLVDSHSNQSSAIHGVDGNIVGTSDTQTLENKTIGSSNTVSASAIKSGRIDMNYLDRDLITIEDVSGLVNPSLNELEDDIDDLEDSLNNHLNDDIEYSDLPTSAKPFAYGTISWSSRNCVGFNVSTLSTISYGCSFQNSRPSNTDYIVVVTAQHSGNIPNHAACSVGKSRTNFTVDCFCNGSRCLPELDFVVFYEGN